MELQQDQISQNDRPTLGSSILFGMIAAILSFAIALFTGMGFIVAALLYIIVGAIVTVLSALYVTYVKTALRQRRNTVGSAVLEVPKRG